MLGEKIGEEHGKVTGRRVLPGDDHRYVKMEVSYEAETTLCGLQGMNMGTYEVYERIPGQIYGEGRGIFMSMDGQGTIWNGHGIGQAGSDGSISFAAAVAFQAGEGPLARLNSVMVLVEHRTDMQGNASSSLYEWKPA